MKQSFHSIRGILDAPQIRARDAWRCAEDTAVTRGSNTLLVWPLEIRAVPELQVARQLCLPGIHLATLVLDDGERLFLPKQRSAQFRADFLTTAQWAYLEADPTDAWLESNYVRWDTHWESALHRAPLSILVINRRPQDFTLQVSCSYPGVVVTPNQATLSSLQPLSLQVDCQGATPGRGEIILQAGGVRQSVSVVVEPSLKPKAPLLQVAPLHFKMEPGQQHSLAISVTSTAKGLLRLDTHPRPRLQWLEAGEAQQITHMLTMGDLPPIRKGRMRISLFLDHPFLNYQATHCWVYFERPVLERQMARLRLSDSNPQGQVAFWRSDGAPISLQASCSEPALQTTVAGGVLKVESKGAIPGESTVHVRDQLSGLHTDLPVAWAGRP